MYSLTPRGGRSPVTKDARGLCRGEWGRVFRPVSPRARLGGLPTLDLALRLGQRGGPHTGLGSHLPTAGSLIQQDLGPRMAQ